MTDEESSKLAKDWLEAERAYFDYLRQFMTVTVTVNIPHTAIGAITSEDGKQIAKLRAIADEKRRDLTF